MEFDIIVGHCKRRGEKYEDLSDPDFPVLADPESCLFINVEKPNADFPVPDQWLRPTDLSSNPQMFVEGVHAGDIQQGAIGTCYLLGALAGLSAHKRHLESIFVAHDFEAGVVAVRFFDHNCWKYIIINDLIGGNEDGNILYSHCKDKNEVWLPLIEKAWAKLHGCYEYTHFGHTHHALMDMTGHAYTVLQAVETSYGHLLVQLRNPWGEGECTGDWSDASGMLTDEICKELKHVIDDEDGTFWMSAEDYKDNFTEWRVASVDGVFEAVLELDIDPHFVYTIQIHTFDADGDGEKDNVGEHFTLRVYSTVPIDLEDPGAPAFEPLFEVGTQLAHYKMVAPEGGGMPQTQMIKGTLIHVDATAPHYIIELEDGTQLRVSAEIVDELASNFTKWTAKN
ncbi:hypothetical protein JKP88DRAFT_287573 [Tribonema minus]|uniref:Calpain catalytic domain-containing protein n=1 Tax=Tribonema minus TaxID=303371 RepID=A0A835ZFZ2_9STRA|nr:hypothetical protein JKP88DRAFT_287573 [Tribonema minus]